MGVKIDELYDGLVIKDEDVFPLTQSISGTNRITLKATALQIKENFNSDINNNLDNLQIELDSKKFDKSIFDKFLKVDGSKLMGGDLYMNNSTVTNYSAKLIPITDNYTLTPTDNASILLIDKENTTNDPDSRVEINIIENSLPIGFNVVIIQTGSTQVKITTTGAIDIWNPDGLKTTKQKYSLINLCMLKPNKVWLFGDMVFSLT